MSDKSNQNISELMDGELEASASAFLVKRILSDQALRESWQRYHTVRAYLQKEDQAPLVVDLGQRVCAQLRNETPQQTQHETLLSRWLKPVLSSAIAASVAMVAVVYYQNNNPADPRGGLMPGVMLADQPSASPQLINPPAAHVARANGSISTTRYPSVRSNIGQYLYEQNQLIGVQPLPVIYREPVLAEQNAASATSERDKQEQLTD